ncbi:hypothetical protein NP493_89g02024 [Ridgeia piscesae]|uniref:C-type lectin domain-containing protein n=1 Tax=Ridgeia piscesae TaxID=27915 RepID=A0AAD9UHR3_RIDPI|nr:hypothetical protein NP493_89g02024 [Ridgeia piscesae]
MSSYIRMSLAILVVCVIQPTRGLHGYYTVQLRHMEKMLSSIQKMSKAQEKICGRELWLMEQIHCTLLSTEDRGKGSNPEDVRCRKRPDGNQSCYRIVRKAMRWEAARTYCRSFRDGMDLVSVESAEEHAFVTSYIKNSHGSCVEFHTSGRKDAKGFWNWMATGQPFHFTSWASGQPDNTGHYCYIWNRYPGWNTWDDYVDANRCFLCEYDLSFPSYCNK